MSSRSPARLLDLANQSLLQNEALAVASLESLPAQLFLPLFLEAVAGRHSETLKAMVRAWPFSHLALGALMKARQPQQDILKAALDGLDDLLAHKIRPRRWKLQVLDLRLNANTNFWDVAPRTWDWSSVCSFEEPEAAQPKTKRPKLLSQFSAQLLSLHQLQELHLDSVFFLEGRLDQVLRCLKSPLVTLSLTNCLLLESDLTHLASCLNTSHLRYLNLSEVNMMAFSPEFLQVVLERASATLHRLALDGCGIRDSQLMSILPALGHCSQLTSFSFRGNPVSVAALENLLRHTVLLSRFRLGLFPVPLETSHPSSRVTALPPRTGWAPSRGIVWEVETAKAAGITSVILGIVWEVEIAKSECETSQGTESVHRRCHVSRRTRPKESHKSPPPEAAKPDSIHGMDPEDPNNSRFLNMTVISQSTPGIQKKLQDLEDGLEVPTGQLLEIAFKIYNNRDPSRLHLRLLVHYKEHCCVRKQ
ncbi:PRAME family member 12-like [Elephas maximus indicus]|uniref:PRAME family member 12-like n=1 Tax=Elephas maximus indicus TaxID=99487 RepID=UPI0021166E55|nr:PRAME family member 12-like [Elephas maximus indicus]